MEQLRILPTGSNYSQLPFPHSPVSINKPSISTLFHFPLNKVLHELLQMAFAWHSHRHLDRSPQHLWQCSYRLLCFHQTPQIFESLWFVTPVWLPFSVTANASDYVPAPKIAIRIAFPSFQPPSVALLLFTLHLIEVLPFLSNELQRGRSFHICSYCLHWHHHHFSMISILKARKLLQILRLRATYDMKLVEEASDKPCRL